jgi:hypothetical protein
MCDLFFKFDISTPAKIWRDTPQNFDKSHGIFLCLSGDFGRAETLTMGLAVK